MSARGVVGIKLGCALCKEVGAFLGDPFIATRLLEDGLDKTDKLVFEYQGFAGVLAFLACGWYDWWWKRLVPLSCPGCETPCCPYRCGRGCRCRPVGLHRRCHVVGVAEVVDIVEVPLEVC